MSGFLEQVDGSLWKPDWAWKPDKEVRQAIARGNRKWRKFQSERSADYQEMRRLQKELRQEEYEKEQHNQIIMEDIMTGYDEQRDGRYPIGPSGLPYKR